jgi:ABC-type transporter Mla subunit MlaD
MTETGPASPWPTRGEQLRQLARQWAEHADVVTLHRLLAHAAAVLTDLAETEQDIADTLTSLASLDGSNLAAQRQQLAEAAASGGTARP